METSGDLSGERWLGAVEEVNEAAITGWAVDLEDPDGSVELEVHASSGWKQVVVADQYREDLGGANPGRGRHGFRVNISGREHAAEISVRFVSSGVDLPGTPIRLHATAAPATDRWRSNIESVGGGRVTGWACDMQDRDRCVELEVWTSAGRQGSVRADIYREDLRDAGFGNGRHGFTIDLGRFGPRASEVSIIFAESGVPVTLEPIDRASAEGGDEIGRWRGNVDSVGSNSIVGWACDMNFPNESLEIEAFTMSGWTQTVLAGGYREDLRDAGVGNGCHAFEIDLRTYEESDGPITLRFAKNGLPLAFSQPEISPREALFHTRFPSQFCSAMEALAWEAKRGFDRRVALLDEAERGANDPSRQLFATADESADPEGLVTRFLYSEECRLRTKTSDHKVERLQDRLASLMWYLSEYTRIRNYAYAVPLSRQQIAYLNQPVPIAGYPPSVTLVLYNFVIKERQDLLQLEEPAVLRDALYWWCVHRAPQMKVENCLVTTEQIDVLRQEEHWIGDRFSLNRFSARYFDENANLQVLDMEKPTHRWAYFIYLVVLSYKFPHLARLLPRNAVRHVVYGSEDRVAEFDRAIAHLAFSQREAGGDAVGLRRKGNAFVKGWGFDLRRNTFVAGRRDVGECLIKMNPTNNEAEPGVCVVGPIYKASGLGQATRASVAVLAGIENSPPSVLRFDLDNPAPSDKALQTNLVRSEGCRAINLIHLNAEAIPSGFAFNHSELFAKSYNIGFFFWELNALPQCQLLALDLLDEIWVASEYVRGTYLRYTEKPVVNVGMAMQPLPAVAAMDRTRLGFPTDATIFLATFDSFSFVERKNPLAVIAAFKLAFPDPAARVHLVLKTQNRRQIHDPYQVNVWARLDRAVSADPRISLIDETFSYSDLLSLKLACDCYVSLHRAEGWGFGMIEAMQLSRPVIATGFSGNMDFCTDDTAYLVDYELIAVREAEYIFAERGSVWADPKIEQAAAHMRAVHTYPDSARTIGQAAAAHVAENFSLEAIGRRYAARLAAVRDVIRSRATLLQ